MTGIIGILLIIANIAFSYKGFTDFVFFDKYKFEVDKILIEKQYYRLISSGFLHINWQHLIFNMISLYFFSAVVESQLGEICFLVVYFVSLIGGDLLALLVHRHHGDYSSVGASGAICGIIFASIALYPGMRINFFFLPIGIPSWLYGVVYIAYSIYGIHSKRDNIGHEAHLGGALIGMLAAIIIVPSTLLHNYLPIAFILIPTLIFIYLIITRPHILLVDNFFFRKQKKYEPIDYKYNEERLSKQQEVDRLLDKIGKKGMSSLTAQEKQTLEEYSKTIR